MADQDTPRSGSASPYELRNADLQARGKSSGTQRPPYTHPQRFIGLAEKIAGKFPPQEREFIVDTLLRRWRVR